MARWHEGGECIHCDKCAELEQQLAALREAAEAVSEDAYACDILIDEPYVVSEKCMRKLKAALNKEESDGGR